MTRRFSRPVVIARYHGPRGHEMLRVTLDCGHQFVRNAKGPPVAERQRCRECEMGR